MLERCVLASLMQDNSLIMECPLVVEDFAEHSHQEIYRRIQQMAMRRQPFDSVTLGSELQESTGNLEWISMLGGMVQDLPSTANFLVYASGVKAESMKHKEAAIGESLANGCGRSEAIKSLMALDVQAGRGGKILNAVVCALESLEKKSDAVHVGIADLDKKLGGFHRSDLVVIAGRPAMGKTAVAFNMANGCNVPVGIISAEQSMEQVGQRFIAITGEVSVHRMRNRTLTEADWKKASDAVAGFHDRDIYINDLPYMTLAEVQRQARQWKHQSNIGILFIDYLQKIAGTKESKRDEVSEVVVGLKNLARELDIPVIALAQVNREVEKDKNKRPFMAHLAESGVIEREADQVITLYRDEVYNKDTPDKGVLEFNICKNRHGPLGVIKTTWIAQYMQVKDYTENWERI